MENGGVEINEVAGNGGVTFFEIGTETHQRNSFAAITIVAVTWETASHSIQMTTVIVGDEKRGFIFVNRVVLDEFPQFKGIFICISDAVQIIVPIARMT